ncbi:hypothetical protein O6H91_16G000200 [Diphasiastrum complanatum]|uniref:Uncharacterized protein n=1 Tax=Diphasiastrum complanatum TaxID=34168 RepID=A0ACC2B923_DIPCM|nr:hypothetical protein O6H91_16G000200 [Diphasiastrum complanatum]
MISFCASGEKCMNCEVCTGKLVIFSVTFSHVWDVYDFMISNNLMLLLATGGTMSNARYSLRSISHGIRRSSIGSEETINNPISMMDHAASQVVDGDVHCIVVPVADGIPEEMGGTIHELDDHMSAMENESGRRSPTVVVEVESLNISQEKKAHPRLLGKLIHRHIARDGPIF